LSGSISGPSLLSTKGRGESDKIKIKFKRGREMTITNSNTCKPEQRRSVRVVHSDCGCAKLATKGTHAPVPGNKTPMSYSEAHARIMKELGTEETKVVIQAPVPQKVEHETHITSSRMTLAQAEARLRKEMGISIGRGFQAPAPAHKRAGEHPGPMGSKGLPEGLEQYRADHPMTFAEAQKRLRKEMGIDLCKRLGHLTR
jgi:hypothetical protein